MEKKLQKINLTYYNLLIVQGLWQAPYQILSIIFLKEFIKLDVATDTMIENVKLVELHTKYATVFVKTRTLKMILYLEERNFRVDLFSRVVFLTFPR